MVGPFSGCQHPKSFPAFLSCKLVYLIPLLTLQIDRSRGPSQRKVLQRIRE